jgi:branched-subunit amino acid aminotransferase/4-amino-4-deoxychorismate lyase
MTVSQEPQVQPPAGSVEETAENPFIAGCAWIEGDYVPIGEARIPILDVGFVRSDLTYDVVAVWEGRFFRFEDHLARLERSCERIRIVPPVTRNELREILLQVVRRSGIRNAYVEAVFTRGVPGPGERDPRLWKPRLYAFAIPYVWIVRPELQARGTDVIVARDTRRIPPGAVDPTVKNFQWGDLVRGLFEAYDRGAWLPILTDGDGNVTEGPGFNVFILADGCLYTPERGVLEGITRMTAIEIAREQGLDVRIGHVPVSLLYQAEEIFLTSTAGGIMPVATLDGQPVGGGTQGPVTGAIRDRYWALHSDPGYTTQVDYIGSA